MPFAHTSALTAKIVPNSILKGYVGVPHGLASTHQDQLNQDLLYFEQRYLETTPGWLCSQEGGS